MKIVMVNSLLLLICCAMAFAHPPRPYVGGSLQGNAIVEQPRESPYDDTPHSGIDYTGMGVQAEGGVAGDIYHLYLGLRQDISGYHEHSNYYVEDDRWLGERLLLGARIHVSDDYANPVKPLLGAAITYGWAQRRLESSYPEECTSVVPVEQHSTGAFGWLLEAGFLVKVERHTFLSLIGHVESLNTRFGDQSRWNSVKNVGQGAAQIGVVYQFEKGIWR